MAELHWQYDRFRNQLWESANNYHVAIVSYSLINEEDLKFFLLFSAGAPARE